MMIRQLCPKVKCFEPQVAGRGSLTSQLKFRKFSTNGRFHAAAATSSCYTVDSIVSKKFYNDEQLEIQRSLRKLIETDINPFVDEWERAEQFASHDLFKKLANAGFLGIHKPTELGGLGLSYKYHAAFLEELGNSNALGVTSAIAVHTDVIVPPVVQFGNERLKEEFARPSISGEFVGAVAVSEPGAGSDVANLKTKAVRKGDDLIINGQKCWISNGMKADWCLLVANTSEGPPHKNKSLICVPMNLPGINRVKIHKIGIVCSDWAQIFFEDVRIPYTNIVGKEGEGFRNLMVQFQDERLSFPLYTLRGMDKIIDLTLEYTKQRKAFGKSIIDNQVVHFKLAELKSEVEALRALTYVGVEMHSAGEDVTDIASMVKLKSGRLARIVADSCLQYWGAMGYSSETLVSRFYRDFRSMSIAGGTDEIMLRIISKNMGAFPRRD